MNKNRQRRNRFYYEQLKREMQFKQAVKALLIDINLLTKEKRNETTHIKRANSTGRGLETNAD